MTRPALPRTYSALFRGPDIPESQAKEMGNKFAAIVDHEAYQDQVCVGKTREEILTALRKAILRRADPGTVRTEDQMRAIARTAVSKLYATLHWEKTPPTKQPEPPVRSPVQIAEDEALRRRLASNAARVIRKGDPFS